MADEESTTTDQEQGSSGEPQAKSGEPTSVEQLKQLFGEMLKQERDAMFADLRRAGVLGGKDKKPGAKEASAPPAPEAPDIASVIARERAFTRAIARVDISDKALARMETAFQAASPEDVGGWVSEYLSDLGLSRADTVATAKPPNQNNTGEPPITAAGAPGGVSRGEVRDPYSLTAEDVQALIRKHGSVHGASREILEAMRRSPRRRIALTR